MFERPQKYQLRLNPAKCTFGVKLGKLLGFIVSQKGIKVDPKKVKAILEMPEPRIEKQVRGFLGRLNYIARFILQLTATYEPLFKLLYKNQSIRWNDDFQEAFGRIKQCLMNPLVLMPLVPGRPLILYMTVLDESMGCMLGEHDDSGRREWVVYYLSKKFTTYEMNYSLLEMFLGMGIPSSKAVHVESYHLVGIQDGLSQIHLREARSHEADRLVAGFAIRV